MQYSRIFCELRSKLREMTKISARNICETIEYGIYYPLLCNFLVCQLLVFEIHPASSENCTDRIRCVGLTKAKYVLTYYGKMT